MDILGFKVTATRVGSVDHFPHHGDDLPHDKFLVKIKFGSSQITFSFFGSYDDFKHHKTRLDDQSLVDAFYSFLSDASAGMMSFQDFIGEFGYEVNKDSKAIHRACAGALSKAQRLGLSEQNIYDLQNKLQEDFGV